MNLNAESIANLLREAFANVHTDAATETWTHAGLTALAQLGVANGLRVDPPRWSEAGRDEGKAGEFLWDLTLSDWPRSNAETYTFPTYFAQAIGTGARLHLVAESEWGKKNSPAATGLAVLEDFAKLLAARCDIKVMIFAFHSDTEASFESLSGLMSRLAATSTDPATYVLYGLDWKTSDSTCLIVRHGRPEEPVRHQYGNADAKKRA